jgi:cellobiose-specific phosphotransferase system component IIC
MGQDSALIDQLQQMERPPVQGALRALPWVLVIVGLVAMLGLGIHGYTAYETITRINANSRIDTANPALLFQDVATNGPRVGSTVEASSRSTYARSLEQFLLDGTGLCMGIVLVVAGLFLRVNQ